MRLFPLPWLEKGLGSMLCTTPCVGLENPLGCCLLITTCSICFLPCLAHHPAMGTSRITFRALRLELESCLRVCFWKNSDQDSMLYARDTGLKGRGWKAHGLCGRNLTPTAQRRCTKEVEGVVDGSQLLPSRTPASSHFFCSGVDPFPVQAGK